MTSQAAKILDSNQVMQKISRMAFEIYENNYLEKKIILAGIEDTGYEIAKILEGELKKIAPFKIILTKITLDKQDPAHSNISISCDTAECKNSCLVLVDDVLNTGKTIVYSLKPFLQANVKKIQTAVLIDRNHSLFPVSANYSGYELATTLDDHVKVIMEPGNIGVYLYS